MTQPLLLTANAKLNLTLDILGKRKDGYHNIESIFQEISFGDEITLADEPEDRIILLCSDKSLENEDNLAWRAAFLVKETFMIQKGISIGLKKKIPVGAGLGGGSSDAATVLKGLNQLWNLKLPEGNLLKLASQLGSDVPFFVKGKSCFVSGRGESVKEIRLPKLFFIIIYPGFSIGTKSAYGLLKPDMFGRKLATRRVVDTFDVRELWNDFEQAVFPQFPELPLIKKELLDSGAENALLSGSGSSLFGVFDSEQKRDLAYDSLILGHRLIYKAESV